MAKLRQITDPASWGQAHSERNMLSRWNTKKLRRLVEEPRQNPLWVLGKFLNGQHWNSGQHQGLGEILAKLVRWNWNGKNRGRIIGRWYNRLRSAYYETLAPRAPVIGLKLIIAGSWLGCERCTEPKQKISVSVDSLSTYTANLSNLTLYVRVHA